MSRDLDFPCTCSNNSAPRSPASISASGCERVVRAADIFRDNTTPIIPPRETSAGTDKNVINERILLSFRRNLHGSAGGAHPDTDGREERRLGSAELLVRHRGRPAVRRQVVQRGSRVLSLCPERESGRQDFPHRKSDGEGEPSFSPSSRFPHRC